MSVIQIAKAIFISIAIWIIPVQTAFACSCVCKTPTTARDKYEIAQNRLAKADFALIGRITNVSPIQDTVDERLIGYHEVTVQPIKVAKGPLSENYIFRYILAGNGMCGHDSFYKKVGGTLNILASYSPEDKSMLIAHNGSCDCDSYYIFNEGGPLSGNPRKRLPACAKRPVLSYRCLVD